MGVISGVRDFFADLSPTWLVMTFAKPYVAGETLDDGVRVAEELLEKRGMWSTLDILGESAKDVAICRKWTDDYIEMQKRVSHIKNSNVSLKPTAMGLLVSEDECRNNIERVVTESKAIGRFVRIDMEDKGTTDATIRIYRYLRDKGFDNVGTVVQAYMKRTLGDVQKLIDDGYKPNLRICKGIYKADRDFATMAEINESYVQIAKLMISNGCYPAMATHDIGLINRLNAEVVEAQGATADKFEWQMLLGVPVEKKQAELLALGHHIRIYVPFGKKHDAAAYCRRRFKENPKMFFFIIRNMFSKR